MSVKQGCHSTYRGQYSLCKQHRDGKQTIKQIKHLQICTELTIEKITLSTATIGDTLPELSKDRIFTICDMGGMDFVT